MTALYATMAAYVALTLAVLPCLFLAGWIADDSDRTTTPVVTR